jgi:hypothetical protein
MTTVAITTSSGGAALAAIGTAAIFSVAAVVVTLGLRPLAVRALDYVDGLPSEAALETADDGAANAVSDGAREGRVLTSRTHHTIVSRSFEVSHSYRRKRRAA